MTVRPFEPDDLEHVVQLLQRTLTADPMTSEVFQRKVLLDPNFDTEGALVAVENDVVIGFGLGIVRRNLIEDQVPDLDRGYITLFAVDENYENRGVGKELLRHLETYISSRGANCVWVSPYAPNYFTPGIDMNAYPNALRFFEKNGYEEVYRPLSMDASILGLSTPEWVQSRERQLAEEGMSFERFGPKHILPLLDFVKSEFPGDWQRYVRETMTKITTGQFSCDQLWIAFEREKVVGFAQHDAERFGPFGVASRQRKRGIGAVLLFKCLQAMREKGLHNAWFLWTDDSTAKLYAQAGFIETRRYAVLRKALD